ncbi:general transcription factor IIF subunit 2-like [Oscarella lobularis]|uniref:general transcription factor IIF subunit 2-like n=1 Tax=Oscarella lobularis TaxID=121494 RepID=UPI003313B7C3
MTEDVDFLDVSSAGKPVWLLKVPNYVKEAWETAEDSEVGTIKINTGKKKPELSLNVSQKLKSKSPDTSFPLEHKMNLNPPERQQMFVFVENVTSDATKESDSSLPPQRFSIVGKIEKRADCRPEGTDVYMSMKKRRIEASAQSKDIVKQLERPVRTFAPKSRHEEDILHEEKKKTEGKRAREDKRAVMDILFKCFERHQYYSFKDLLRLTDQPPTFLKEILKEIASYNTKSPHKHMWELKEEYRCYKGTDTAKAEDG